MKNLKVKLIGIFSGFTILLKTSQLLGHEFVASQDVIQKVPFPQGAYLGPISVFLDKSSKMSAQLETKDLLLCSVTWEDYDNYVQLLGNPLIMKTVGKGKALTPEEVQKRMHTWVTRWEMSHDPFSAFAIFLKDDDFSFIGHIVLGHADHYGQAELAYIIHPEFQNKGYGKEAVTALIYGFVPLIVQNQFWVNLNEYDCPAGPLQFIHATTRLDNNYSVRILEAAGMKPGEQEIIWDHLRIHYTLSVEELMKNAKIRTAMQQ